MAVLELQASHQQPEAPLPVQQAPAKGGRLTLRRLAVWLAQPMLQMRWLAAMVDSTAEQQGGALVGLPEPSTEIHLKAALLSAGQTDLKGCLGGQKCGAALVNVLEPFIQESAKQHKCISGGIQTVVGCLTDSIARQEKLAACDWASLG